MASFTPEQTSNPYVKIRNTNRIARFQFPSDMGKYYIAFEFAEYGPQYNSGISDVIQFATAPINMVQQQAGTLGATIAASNPVLATALTAAGISLNAVRQQRMTYGINGVNASIALPMPPNLVDDQQLDYNAQNLKNVAAQGVSAATQALGGPNMGNAGAVLESVGTFASVFTGMAVNPFLAMMFNGPRFKTHQFGWRFSPKNESETDELVKIINIFKAKALPTQTAGGAIFTYPDVVLISLYPVNARNKMYKFKPAVLTQVSVHHAPTGTPSFFATSNAPVEVELKLQLSEISIWTSSDFPGYDIPTGAAGR